MLSPTIKEDFLYYVWQTKAFDVLNIKTIHGKEVSIKDFGIRNTDSGPDFSRCKVEIDGILWAGNVEMHVRTSDWDRHGHDLDLAYANVILHVVYEHDTEIINAKDKTIHTIELKDSIHQDILSHYLALVNAPQHIACEASLSSVPQLTRTMWMDRVAIERLERKHNDINFLLEKHKGDWLQVLFVQLCAYIGGTTNKIAFSMLAESITYTILLKHQRLEELEALLYGQAGMLLDGSLQDPYYQSLRNEYTFLSKKYSLQAIPSIVWKFAKMRPASFPTVRIAQLAQMIFRAKGFLFDTLIKQGQLDMLDTATSPYWDTHYRFGKESVYKVKNVGKAMQDNIAINVVAPMQFAYGKSHLDDKLKDAAMLTLQSRKSESNRISKIYKGLDSFELKTAWDSQACIELYTEYCSPKKCMSCSIGHSILKNLMS